MHPFFAPSDLWSLDLLRDTFDRDFAGTLFAEVAVVLLVLLGQGTTRKRRISGGSSGLRLDRMRRRVAPGWWVLPIYIWACEGHLKMLSVLETYSYGLVTPPFSWVVLGLYEIFFALGCLVLIQTLLVAATGGQAITLGVEGKARTAATAALLAVTADVLLYLGAVRWMEKAASGAL